MSVPSEGLSLDYIWEIRHYPRPETLYPAPWESNLGGRGFTGQKACSQEADLGPGVGKVKEWNLRASWSKVKHPLHLPEEQLIRHSHSQFHQTPALFLGIYAYFPGPVNLQRPLPTPALVHRITAGGFF